MRVEVVFPKDMGLPNNYDPPGKLRFVTSWADKPELIPPAFICAYGPLSDSVAHLLCMHPERCIDARPSENLSCYFLLRD